MVDSKNENDKTRLMLKVMINIRKVLELENFDQLFFESQEYQEMTSLYTIAADDYDNPEIKNQKFAMKTTPITHNPMSDYNAIEDALNQ